MNLLFFKLQMGFKISNIGYKLHFFNLIYAYLELLFLSLRRAIFEFLDFKLIEQKLQ